MEDSTTLPMAGPTTGSRDLLTDLLKDGARRLLAEAVEAEVAAWIDAHADHKDSSGRQQVVGIEGVGLSPGVVAIGL